MKNLLTLGKALDKAEQKKIIGSGDPIDGPGSGGGIGNIGNDPMPCFCLISKGWLQVPCNSTCPNGSAPICP